MSLRLSSESCWEVVVELSLSSSITSSHTSAPDLFSHYYCYYYYLTFAQLADSLTPAAGWNQRRQSVCVTSII